MRGFHADKLAAALVPLVNDIKQHAPDLWEIGRTDFPVELSLTVGELREILVRAAALPGFYETLKAHRLDFVNRNHAALP